MARAALLLVPRLQRKHYELIPKQLDEMSFWVNFFSHVTVLVASEAPDVLQSKVLQSEVRAPARQLTFARCVSAPRR